MDEAIVASARAAVGPDVPLMVDAGGSDAFWPNGYKWALRTADMLAGYGIGWFEEPLSPDALADFQLLREHSRVRIAGGEVLTRRQSFLPWLQGQAFDVVQPDVTKVGGISEERRIAWTALDNGVAFVPHGWNTALGLAADLQLASAIPGTEFVEYLTGSPYIDSIVAEPWRLDANGMLAVPNKPGLGVALDMDRVAHYARGERLPVTR
jgi:L-alanine-DL-glutamate epimerase-like enolase superfamily enzyme